MLKSNHSKAVISVALLAVFLLPFAAGAVYPYAPTRDVTASKLVGILFDIANWVFTILVVVTVIFGLMAAYQYNTALGDAEKLMTAKMNTLYAMIALGVGLLAFSIPRIVSDIVRIPLTPAGPPSQPYGP